MRLEIAIAAAAALLLGCGAVPKWEGAVSPTSRDLRRVAIGLDEGDIPAFHPSEIPDVPAKQALRPCCAFGHDLSVRAGFVPVPGFSVGNVKGVEELGHHNYDAGILTRERSGKLRSENNGQVYTCRGGFIDTAHVRDYADWMLFAGAQLLRSERPEAVLELPDEAGVRRIVVKPPFFEMLDAHGWETVVPLARWLAYQLSIWHEIIQWYGWSEIPSYPEKVSAFSPEDLYSNLLGARIASAVTMAFLVDSEPLYNEAMNLWLATVLEQLGAVPVDVGVAAMREVDGVWWDSSKRLPDWDLVRRRKFEIGPRVGGWLVQDVATSPEVVALLAEHCGSETDPVVLHYEEDFEGVPFREMAALEIEVEPGIARHFPLVDASNRWITQDDFPTIIEAIRAENAAVFGQGADRPDR